MGAVFLLRELVTVLYPFFSLWSSIILMISSFFTIKESYQVLAVQCGHLYLPIRIPFLQLFSYIVCLICLNFELCRSLFGMLMIHSRRRLFAIIGVPAARYMQHLQQCFHSSLLLWLQLCDKAQLIMDSLFFKRKSLFCVHNNENIYMISSILSLYISPGKEAILKL